jgi:hypothetical protein
VLHGVSKQASIIIIIIIIIIWAMNIKDDEMDRTHGTSGGEKK